MKGNKKGFYSKPFHNNTDEMSAIFCTSVSQASQVPFMVADFRGSAAVRNPQDKIGGLIKRVKFYSMGP